MIMINITTMMIDKVLSSKDTAGLPGKSLPGNIIGQFVNFGEMLD